MKAEHQQWIAEALRLGRANRCEEANQLISLVICEDGKNPQALWLLAVLTPSLHERSWALKTLLRIEPKCYHAREMLNATDQKLQSASRQANIEIRPLKSSFLPPYLTQ